MSRWTELAFTVSLGEAEAVGERLVEAGAGGVEERDASTIAKAPEGKVALVVWIAPEKVEDFLAQMKGIGDVQTRDRDEEEWRDAWKRYFGIRRVGRFVLVPSWERWEGGAELPIHLDPGRAFGTGGHPSTRLCLGLIGRLELGCARFLDVGCGSGVLSIACARRWPEARGLGVDLDPEAAEVSRENAERNEVAGRLAFRAGTLDGVEGRWDVICANIQADVLIGLRDALAAHLAPGGRLILSGILVEQADEVRAAFSSLRVIEQLDEEGWRAMVLT